MCPTGTCLPAATKPADLRSAFDILDADRDGKISHDDLKTSYVDVTDDVIGSMMNVADLNKNGYVEYDEFENVVVRSASNSRRGVLEDVFNDMDRDGDGKVGHEDLRSYLSAAGIDVNDDDINAMVRLGGGDGDGVTFQGFVKILAV